MWRLDGLENMGLATEPGANRTTYLPYCQISRHSAGHALPLPVFICPAIMLIALRAPAGRTISSRLRCGMATEEMFFGLDALVACGHLTKVIGHSVRNFDTCERFRVHSATWRFVPMSRIGSCANYQ